MYCLKNWQKLEGPKHAKVEEDGEKNHGESGNAFPSEDEPQEKNEGKKSKEPKPPSLKPYMPPLPVPQGFVKMKLVPNLASFLMCLRSCM